MGAGSIYGDLADKYVENGSKRFRRGGLAPRRKAGFENAPGRKKTVLSRNASLKEKMKPSGRNVLSFHLEALQNHGRTGIGRWCFKCFPPFMPAQMAQIGQRSLEGSQKPGKHTTAPVYNTVVVS